MYVGVIRLHSFTGFLNLIGVWLHEDQRTNTIKTHVYNEIGLSLKILLSTPH